MSFRPLTATPRIPFDALAQAIVDRLSADLPALGFYAFFVPPEDPANQTPLPFVVVDQMAAADDSTMSTGAWVVECRISIFSKGYGAKEATGLMNQILLSLGREGFPLADEFELEDLEAGNPDLVLDPGDDFLGSLQVGHLPLRFFIKDLSLE